jgi:hypothetical protein
MMKNETGRVTFKEFLKMLRPDLRPSLAKKEFERLLRSMKRREIFDEYEMRGKSLEARSRIMSILDSPEHVNVESATDADDSKTESYDPQATGSRFWDWWDSCYGGHPSATKDYAALKSFWAYWGTSLKSVEALAQQRARKDYEHRVENGLDLGSARYLKAEYDKWRHAQTSLARRWAAKAKARKEAADKAEVERIRIEKKAARKKTPHVTKFANAEKESDRQAFEDYSAQ